MSATALAVASSSSRAWTRAMLPSSGGFEIGPRLMRCSERHEQAVVGVEYLQAASVLADHTGSGETRPRFDPGDVTPAEEDDPDLPGPVSQGDLNGCDTGSGLHAHLAHPS